MARHHAQSETQIQGYAIAPGNSHFGRNRLRAEGNVCCSAPPGEDGATLSRISEAVLVLWLRDGAFYERDDALFVEQLHGLAMAGRTEITAANVVG